MARLLGIDVDRTVSITFVGAAALAAIIGTMYLMYYGVVSFADSFVPVKAFTAAVLGGIGGSLPGAVLGGLLGSLIETLWSAYFSIDYKDIAAFAHSRDHYDLCHGHPRPARRGRECEMAPGASAPASRVDIVRALRDTVITALIAFGLFRADRLQHRPEHPQRARPGDALALLAALVMIVAGAHALLARAADRSLARSPRRTARSRPNSPRARPLRARWLVPFTLGFADRLPPACLALAGPGAR